MYQRDNSRESVSLLPCGSTGGTQVARLGGKCLHKLCLHITGPGEFLNAGMFLEQIKERAVCASR